ncbi:hypothetical protein EIP86_006641 [Pleurotus ostreatoroseus]|nr:hypothetical protein EIP86_006641 [Pleurotus ostreatoroseus]
MSASSSSLQAPKRRQADSYVYGYMVPEAFLEKEGRWVLEQGLEALHQGKKSTAHLRLKSRVSRVFESISELDQTQIPLELMVALGAWRIMTRAGLLAIWEFVCDGHGMHPTPCLEDDLLLHPSAINVHHAGIEINLNDRYATLTRVHTSGCDDQLGVKSVEYAIALASNDPSAGLPWGKSLDEIALSIKPIVDSLQVALGTKHPPVLLPVAKNYRPVFEIPQAMPSPQIIPFPQVIPFPRAQMKQKDVTMLAMCEERAKEIQWKSRWMESMYSPCI